jgi:hypothetical protein
MARGLDPGDPTRRVPIALYNEMCGWIETNLGRFNAITAGRAIGRRAYDQMVKDGTLGQSPTPHRILEELKRVASLMIQDPKGRGWEILRLGEGLAVMRRTQTFNCPLQEGLLLSLIERTGVAGVRVQHAQCERRGAEFCDYEVRWRAA